MNEMIIKRAETMNVARKTTFSKPRLVKDEEPPPQDLANPVPLDCMNIITIRATPRIV
jgi:hypothetical protein